MDEERIREIVREEMDKSTSAGRARNEDAPTKTFDADAMFKAASAILDAADAFGLTQTQFARVQRIAEVMMRNREN